MRKGEILRFCFPVSSQGPPFINTGLKQLETKKIKELKYAKIYAPQNPAEQRILTQELTADEYAM